MPKTLRLSDGNYMRRPDVQGIMNYLREMNCVEVIGFSNVGKSALLRLLAQRDVWLQELGEAGGDVVPIYIDCNRMLDMTDQGFYEVVLRCMRENNELIPASPELEDAYNMLVAPASDFQIPLSFNQGVTSILQNLEGTLVLLFDEFDEPFARIDPRVFLNLRALIDRYGKRLVYVTATVNQITAQQIDEDHRNEFCELFHRTWFLAPLTRPDVERYARQYMEMYEVNFTEPDIEFLYKWAGGHPRLLEEVSGRLEDAIENGDSGITERVHLHQKIAGQFRSNEKITLECAKIWDTRSEFEQEALLALFTAHEDPDADILVNLHRTHVLMKIDGKSQTFAQTLTDYIQRKAAQQQPESAQLWVDVDSGEVTIGGEPAEPLTNLEYKLMLLLFQNSEKIVDKYQIVTNVWGESYIDEVDDARIEKLVSRLRQKIEPDPSNPVFLTTVRGRGYRLALA